MFARINSLGVYALNGFSVSVEADISGGLPQFTIVGLPDSAVREATDRVRSALKNLSFVWPVSRITVNLAPGDIRKTGPVYDLPVLLAILAASGQLPVPGPEDAFIGELSLDGGVRSVTGVLPMALAAVQNGVKSLWSPVGSFATLSDDPVPVLKRVVTTPLDQTVAVGGQATLTAYTNLGDNADVTYAWELRALDSTPDAWVPIDGATARSVTLPVGVSGYVRCTATYAPEGGELQTVSGNQARVRVEPGVPSGLAVGEVGETHAALSWAPADVDGTAFTLAYRAHGSQDWTEVTGLTEPSYDLAGLAPETIYEWCVQAVVGAGEDALVTDWIDGPSFTTLAPPEPQEYHVTAGANGTWKPGQPGLAFTIDAPRDKFLSLAVDGVELVQGTDYTVVEGSTVVTLSPDYLANLAEGTHNLVATFSDGAASTAFTVAPADPGPTPNPPSPTPPDPTPTPNPSDPTPAPAPDSGGKALAPTGDPLGAALPLVGVLAVASVCMAIAAFAHKRRPVLKRNRRF